MKTPILYVLLACCVALQVESRHKEEDHEEVVKEALNARRQIISILLDNVEETLNGFTVERLPENIKSELEEKGNELRKYSDSLSEKVDEILNASNAKVEKIKEAALCLKNAAINGQREAARGVVEIGECIYGGVKNSSMEVIIIAAALQQLRFEAEDLFKETTRKVFECRKEPKPVPCAKEVLQEAQNQIAGLMQRGKEILIEATQLYKQFIEGMKQCTGLGAKIVEEIHKTLKEEVRECLK